MRILLAIDGSAQSQEAARLLCRLPLPQQVEISVVAVVQDEPPPAAGSQASPRQAAARQAVQASVEEAVAMLNARGLPADFQLVSGHPKRNLLKSAETLDVDLIVLGDHGHSALARAVLGSTSDYVVNHARCSVLMVRPPRTSAEAAEQPFKMLLAYDGSGGSRSAVRQLFSLGWSPDCQVRVAMLLERPSLLPDDEIYDEPALEEAERDGAAWISEHGRGASQAQVTYLVREVVHIGSGLTHLLREDPCDIVWVGGTGRSEISKFFLGCVSRHVLHHANCSVWVAREKAWREQA